MSASRGFVVFELFILYSFDTYFAIVVAVATADLLSLRAFRLYFLLHSIQKAYLSYVHYDSMRSQTRHIYIAMLVERTKFNKILLDSVFLVCVFFYSTSIHLRLLNLGGRK